MLEILRAAVGSWIAKIFIGILIIGFAIWGVAGSVLTTNSSSAVITAGESKVSLLDFRRQYDQIVDVFSAQFGRRLTREEAKSFGLEGSLISQLRAEKTMEEKARLLNIGLSSEKLAEEIARNPEYKDVTGKFSKSRLALMLRSTGKTESQFLREEEARAKREQLSRGLFGDIAAPEAFIEASKQYLGEKRTVDIITLSPADAGEIAPATDEQLKTYFDAHKQEYRAPEYRKITVVKLDPEGIADETLVTEEQIQQEYEASANKYVTPEKRRIQQVVFKDKATADAAAEKIKAGSTFDDIMADQKVTAEDATLGLLAKKPISDVALADAAFGLALNTPSAVIEGKFGPVILRVTEIAEGNTVPLESVKDELRKAVAVRGASENIEDIYNSIEDARAGGASLVEAAEKAKLTPITVEAVDAQGLDKAAIAVKTIPAKQEFLAEVFKTEVGDEASAVDIDLGSYAFFEVMDIEPARERTLDEVKDKVQAAWINQETNRLLDEKLAQLEKDIDAGKSLKELGYDVQSIGPFLRTDKLETLDPAAIQLAFGTKLNKKFSTKSEDGKSRILGLVTAIDAAVEGDVEITDKQIEQLKAQVRNEMFSEMLEQLAPQIGVKVNQNNIDAALNL